MLAANDGKRTSLATDQSVPERALALRQAEPPTARQPRLLDRVRQAVRARHYSRRTEKAYIAWTRRYVLSRGKRHPSEIGAIEMSQFLSSLATKGNVSR
jgi:integrase-like protein